MIDLLNHFYIDNTHDRMLDKFVQEQRKKPKQQSDINVTYLVSGQEETESGVQVSFIILSVYHVYVSV